MGMPLSKIKVIDMTRWAFGPFSAKCLADMGAHVMKVEDPYGGDGSRGTHKAQGVNIGGTGSMNPLFELLNRGKKGIAIDMKKERGREILYELVRKSDVFMTSHLPKSCSKLGIEYETLKEINPRIIYACCGAWGERGPKKDDVAWDGATFARSGLMHVLGEKGTPPPTCPIGMGDLVASVTMTYGILAALLHRENTGRGQRVDVSLYGTMITVLSAMTQQICLSTGRDYSQQKRTEPVNAMNLTYQTRDNRWLLFNIHQTDPYWRRFCEALGILHLEKDDRFKDHNTRCGNANSLRLILEDIISKKDLHEWTPVLDGKRIPWGPVKTPKEVWDEPQTLENDYIVSYEHPNYGTQRSAAVPIKLSEVTPNLDCAAPELGQHTEEILLEFGYTWEEIIKFKDEGAII